MSVGASAARLVPRRPRRLVEPREGGEVTVGLLRRRSAASASTASASAPAPASGTGTGTGRGTAAGAGPHLVTLVGKPGCHLCDEAREVVRRVAGELGADVEERSILDDPALYDAYWEKIPVTLVDGQPHDYWRVDERRLRAALGG